MKTELSPGETWHGLPLSPAQNREVLNYIERCERAGINPDTPELRAMLADMLSPPEIDEDSLEDMGQSTESAIFAATHEEPGDQPADDAP